MPLPTILVLAAGLGMDAMSVSMAVGVRWHGPRQKFRLAWHMGLFQFLMPIMGWVLGRQLAEAVRTAGTYVAGGLLMLLGVKMIYEVYCASPASVARKAEGAAEHALHIRTSDPTRGFSLIGLSVATSIDALVAGFSLALTGAGIWQASMLIGLVAAAMALAGVTIGQRVGKVLGKPAELLGGAILTGLGLAFLCW